MKQIYKNLYQDEETGKYIFADENDTRMVVEQQSYILIYILETLLKGQSGEQVFDMTGDENGKT